MSATNPAGKRHKSDQGGPMGGQHDGYHHSGYGRMAPQSSYQHPPYGAPGGPSHMAPQSGYMPWQHGPTGQYGAPPPPPPPHAWGQGSAPPPGSMYGQRTGAHSSASMTPERPGYGGPPPPYRGPPGPMSGPSSSAAARMPNMPPSGGRHGSNTPDPSGGGSATPAGPDSSSAPPNGSYHWNQQSWSQHQWNGAPPSHGMYGSSNPSGGPPMNQPSGYGGMYSSSSPARMSQSHPRSSPEAMGGYPGSAAAGTAVCLPIDGPEAEAYGSTRSASEAHHDDDGNGSASGRDGGSTRDKGRGSYKCGRCGVPKKGHVCPYQPKLARRPGEPLPEMRCAAVQVEMDEFMTLRRLNLKIQGLPESYATEPTIDGEVNCVGEPRPPMVTSASANIPAMHHHQPQTLAQAHEHGEQRSEQPPPSPLRHQRQSPPVASTHQHQHQQHHQHQHRQQRAKSSPVQNHQQRHSPTSDSRSSPPVSVAAAETSTSEAAGRASRSPVSVSEKPIAAA